MRSPNPWLKIITQFATKTIMIVKKAMTITKKQVRVRNLLIDFTSSSVDFLFWHVRLNRTGDLVEPQPLVGKS